MSNIPNNFRPAADTPLFFDDPLTKQAWENARRFQTLQARLQPAINLIETPEGLEIEMAIPGLRADDLFFDLNEKGLTVRYDAEPEGFENVRERRTWHREHFQQSFQRFIALPTHVFDLEDLEISEDNGLLLLFIPKREQHRGHLAPVAPFSNN